MIVQSHIKGYGLLSSRILCRLLRVVDRRFMKAYRGKRSRFRHLFKPRGPIPFTGLDPGLEEYRSNILREVDRVYAVASAYRERTREPLPFVETVFADRMEERVELLVPPQLSRSRGGG
ncbi:hypothetical protein CSUB_C0022 [Candidatus Caldarchaeum subterraneum]|uniref:Uncharacterized protein n=1 Tax=Caldiarchaeum subterraneum TaxID=311458 RepID=E6N430_CALS0|nr:hypothetical protein HGMM_F51C10C04 [Candidatus Caldarchaeum subterraneum]BAJ49891.1 hypothetical protein CSUB_C0022 [Candidatus Caldarchaeum subterraneum]